MTTRPQSGFTLIEVLVAMAIFGVMTLLAYQALDMTLANSSVLSDRMERLQTIQRTVRYLSNDFASAAPRPVRDELGTTYLPAVMVSPANDFALAITHGSWTNPAGLPRSTQQRTVYKLEEDRLLRIYYTVLDSTYANNVVSTEILDGVVSLEFVLFDENGKDVNQWPPTNVLGAAGQIMRPRAVEIILTLEDQGEIRRIIEVAS